MASCGLPTVWQLYNCASEARPSLAMAPSRRCRHRAREGQCPGELPPGRPREGEFVKLNGKGKDKGYEHQDHRSQWATIYSVVRLVRGADWA
jgi:hypothetical protein